MTEPEDPLSNRLDELGPCWLELRGCCQIVYIHCRLSDWVKPDIRPEIGPI